MRKRLLLLVNGVLLVVRVWAQGDPVWRWVPRAGGTTVRAFAAAVEDPSGVLWFATPAGLLRYDGLFRWIRRSSEGLPANELHGLAWEPPATLWLATANGLAPLHVGEEAVLRDVEFPGQPVYDVLRDSAGRLWVATQDGLYVRLEPHGWTVLPGTEGRLVQRLREGPEGDVWCLLPATPELPGYLLRVNSSGVLERIPLPPTPEMAHTTDLLILGPGTWWVGTLAGLWIYNGRWTLAKTEVPQPWVRRIVAQAGTVWVATDQGLLRAMPDGRWQRFTETNGLPSRDCTGLFFDARGVFWVATDLGFAIADGSWSQLHVDHGLPSERIQALAADLDGGVWVGTDQGLVHWGREAVRRFDRVDGLPSRDISALFVDAEGQAWVGTQGATAGLALPLLGRWSPLFAGGELPEGDVRAVEVDRAGRVWIGSGILRALGGVVVDDLLGSLSRYDRRSWKTWPMAGTPIALAEGSDGTLWAATRSGLYRISEDSPAPEPLPFPAEVRALLADPTGGLWVGTSDGLLRRTAGGWEEPLPAGLLSSRSVWSLAAANDGALWVGLEGVIAVREPTGQWLAYGTQDGLPNLPVVALAVATDGSVWAGFGQPIGLWVHRGGRTTVQTAFRRAPTGVVGEPAVLVAFTGGDGLTPPEQLRFSYRINDGSWSVPDFRREIVLDNLQHGQQIRFAVRTVARDGRVDPTPAVAEFRVDLLPPQVEILRPRPDEPVRGTVPIVGDVWDPTDFDRFEVLLPGEEPIARSHPVRSGTLALWDTRTVPDGRYTVRVRAWDRSDGPFDTVHLREVRLPLWVDNTAPLVALDVPKESGPPVPFSISASDARLARYQLEYRQQGDWQAIAAGPLEGSRSEWEGEWSAAGLHGPVTVRLQVEDAAGNLAEAVRVVRINNPAALPAVAITAPADGTRLADRVEIVGTAWDEMLTDYRLELLPSGESAPVRVLEGARPIRDGLLGVWEVDDLPEGAYLLRLIARDNHGYRSEASVRVVLDHRPPEVRWEQPAADALFPTEGVVPAEVALDEPGPTTYRLEVRSLDSPDLWESVASGQLSSDAEKRVSVDWRPVDRAGPHQFRLVAVDAAGNRVESLSPIFGLDGTPPTAAWRSPTPGAVLAGIVELLGTADDEHFERYAVEYQDAQGRWRTISAPDPRVPVTNGLLARWEAVEGAQRLRLTVWDRAGHRSRAEIPVSVDVRPPRAVIETPRPETQVAGAIPIRGTADDAHFSRYWLEHSRDRRVWEPIGEPRRFPVRQGLLGTWQADGPPGTVWLRLVVEDVLGRRQSAVVSVYVVPTRSPEEPVRLVGLGGTVQASLPPRALDRPAALTLNPLEPERTAPSPWPLREIVALEPAGLEFRGPKWAVLAFRTPPESPGTGRRWSVVRWEKSRWELLGGTESAGWIRLPIRRTGTYGLAAVPEADSPALPGSVGFAAQPRAFSPAGGSLPERTYFVFSLSRPRAVRIRIYDAVGRLVRRLSLGTLPAGRHAIPWEGKDDVGRQVPHGLYVVAADVGDISARTTVLVWGR